MVGGRIAAFERSILAKTIAKAAEKVEQNNPSNESSAEEERAKELVAMEQLIRAQINHNLSQAGQPGGPSAAH